MGAFCTSSNCGSKPPSLEKTTESRKLSMAAKPTTKARRKAVLSARCWPTATCTYWIGYGNARTSRAASKRTWCAMRTTLWVLCAKGVEEPLKVVRHVLERLGLTLNEAKTKIVDATEASFDFLGFSIQMRRGASTGTLYPNVTAAAKSVKKIKTKLTALTQRTHTAIPLKDIVGSMNRSLRGWANYFHYRNSGRAMSKVKSHAQDRLRTHLMKRHKVKDRGTGLIRFPHRKLYECYGLYKVPTVAGWRSAHASV